MSDLRQNHSSAEPTAERLGPQTAPDHKRPQAPPTEGYDEAEANYRPKTVAFWTILSGMYLSVFLVSLDRTIVATAIPKITDQFRSLQDVGWYGSAYMLTGASSTLVFGRIYKFYSIKWVFIASILIFEIGSAICGAAPNSTALIVGRAVAGLGSSGIFSGSMMILVPMVPLRKRPMFTGLFSAAFGISSVLGPLLGGILTERASWRWCFFINLPIGGFTIVTTAFLLRIDSQKGSDLPVCGHFKRLDPMGTFFFVPGVVSLLLALQWGGTTYPWSSPKVIGLLVTFAVLFLGFCAVQVHKPATATMPIRIITQRSIAGGALFTLSSAGSMMSIVYFLPMWFQAVKGDSAIQSGISTIPLVLSLVAMSILSGAITQRIGYYVPVMLLSPLMAATGAGMLSTLTPTTSQSHWIGYECLYGFGVGLAMQTALLAAQAVLPRHDISTGVALLMFCQQLGGAVFVAAGQNIFTSHLFAKLSEVSGVDPRIILKVGATELRNSVSSQHLHAVVDAFNFGLTRTFLVAVGLSSTALLAALTMEWKDIRQGPKRMMAQKSESKGFENGQTEVSEPNSGGRGETTTRTTVDGGQEV